MNSIQSTPFPSQSSPLQKLPELKREAPTSTPTANSSTLKTALVAFMAFTSLFKGASAITQPIVSDIIPVSANFTGANTFSDLAQTKPDEIVYVWDEAETIQIKALTKAGNEITPQRQIFGSGQFYQPRIIPRSGGRYTVIAANSTNPDWKIVSQNFNANHTEDGAPSFVFPSIPGKQSDPDVITLTNRNIVVSCSYDQYPTAPSQLGVGVTYQGFDPDMSAPLPSFSGSCYAPNLGPHYFARMAPTSNSGLDCVFYAENGNYYTGDVLRVRINSTNQKTTSAQMVPSNTSGQQFHPAIAVNPNNETTIAWASTIEGSPTTVTGYYSATYNSNIQRTETSDRVLLYKNSLGGWTNQWFVFRTYLDIIPHPEDGNVFFYRNLAWPEIQHVLTNGTVAYGPMNISGSGEFLGGGKLAQLDDGWAVIFCENRLKARIYTLPPQTTSTTSTVETSTTTSSQPTTTTLSTSSSTSSPTESPATTPSPPAITPSNTTTQTPTSSNSQMISSTTIVPISSAPPNPISRDSTEPQDMTVVALIISALAISGFSGLFYVIAKRDQRKKSLMKHPNEITLTEIPTSAKPSPSQYGSISAVPASQNQYEATSSPFPLPEGQYAGFPQSNPHNNRVSGLPSNSPLCGIKYGKLLPNSVQYSSLP